MILDKLRQATAVAHSELERQFDLSARLSSLSNYQATLQAFAGYYRPLERRLAALLAHAPAHLEFAARRKVPLLYQDLLALGESVATIEAHGNCEELPELATPAAAFGCLYVLEGSTLGGRVIAPLVRKRLGLDASNGAAYFNNYGDAVLEMWESFRHAMCIFVGRNNSNDRTRANLQDDQKSLEEAQIIASAEQTFATLAKWLGSGGTSHACQSTRLDAHRAAHGRSG